MWCNSGENNSRYGCNAPKLQTFRRSALSNETTRSAAEQQHRAKTGPKSGKTFSEERHGDCAAGVRITRELFAHIRSRKQTRFSKFRIRQSPIGQGRCLASYRLCSSCSLPRYWSNTMDPGISQKSSMLPRCQACAGNRATDALQMPRSLICSAAAY